jgi:hypothetical protein
MIRETYVCMCGGGEIEYGFTYKNREGDEDTLRDEPVGRTTDREAVNRWLERYQ